MASRQLHYFPQAHPYVPRSVETSEDQQASDEAKPFKLACPDLPVLEKRCDPES